MTVFYIIDTTLNQNQEKRFSSYLDTLRYLEGMTVRAYKQNRKTRMLMLEEIGHGYDDRDSINFVRSMASAFEMGVIRNDAGQIRHMKCDITGINQYQSEEFGN